MKKNCTICKKEYQVKPYRSHTAKFCSFKCHGLSLKGNSPWNKGKKGIHLSPKTEFKKGHKPLAPFKKGVIPWNKGLTGVQVVPRGKDHWLWKGTTPENKLLRRSKEFKLWREAVFKRDDWICQECKIRGGELHPHHIKPFAFFPELRFAIDNGITLCKGCHMKTDTWGGRVKSSFVATN